MTRLKITAQEEYGLRCIVQLAREEGGAPVMVREIAEREGLSVAYVEKLLWTISRGGIAESVRGPKGGYRLTRPCTEISIGEVMRVLGGIPSKDEICSQFTGNHDICVHHVDCGLRPIWASITDFVHSVFDKIPISVLLQGEVDVKMVQLTNKSSKIECPVIT